MPVLVPGLIPAGQAPPLPPTAITWEGLSIVQEGPYYLESFTGWLGLPDGRSEDMARGRGHGSYTTPVQYGLRVVTASGWCASEHLRDTLLAQLSAVFVPPDDPAATRDLTVEIAGRTLSAKAQLMRFAPGTLQGLWGQGAFPWAIQWRCPDPRRYGTVQSASTTLQQPGGGITPPFTPPLVLPERPAGGFVSVSNDGNAPTPPVITYWGPQSRPGVVNRTRGLFQSYALDLGDTDTLMVDVASGRALLNGNAYRAPAPGSAVTAEFELARGVNDLEVLGSATGVGSPGMSVSWKPAWW